MKYRIYSIIAFVVFALVGCVETEELDNIIDTKDKVLLSVKTTTGVVTRAEDTSYEERIDWLDVFFFNDDFTVYHKERIDVSSAPVYKSGEFSISKKRSEFEENEGYYIYIVANASTNLVSDEAGIESWEDLLALEQLDYDIHYSAFIDVDGDQAFPGAPERFLMDGFVYVDGSREPANMPECVINDTDVDEIRLCGTLYRAASKFIINIKEGESVEFQKELFGKKPQYYINQLPVSTKVLPLAADEIYHPTTQNTQTTDINPYTFLWNDKDRSMTIVGYGYADDWSKLEYTKQTSMVFNLPMFWDKDKDVPGMETESPDNWYKIPLSKDKKFERNTCYIINIIVNAVGAEEREWALELKDIEYITLPWQEVRMDIGDYNAAFLTLNTDLVKIYDSNIDKNQLTFTSSSPIKSIILKDSFGHDERNGYFEPGVSDGLYAYYIDKFGQKIQLGADPGFDLKDVDHPEWTKVEILAKENNLYQMEGVDDDEQYIRAVVWDEHKRALNGNITIYSPILAVEGNEDLDWNSHFNTTRYLEFEVENEQGITAIFRVEQIPYILITHEEGFFSYRSDQKYSDDWEEASHFLNYKGGKSLHLSGLMWNYVYDWTNEPGPEDTEYWGTDELHRNYSWVPSHGTGLAHNCEVLHYGNIGVPHTFKDSRGVEVTYTYGGLYRSAVHPTGAFVRERYYLLADAQCNGIYSKGGYSFNRKNYDHPKGDVQGNAVGPVYEENGKKYRKHFTWNVQPIFYNLYVSKVYDADGTNPSGKARTKGQADINSMTHATDVSIDGEGTGWMSWGIQSYTNHRMYNIRTTTPQEGYTIGFPTLEDNSVTSNIPSNAIMISPNLQVASQLGETRYQSVLNTAAQYPNQYKVPEVGKFYKLAEEHCREYVETVYINEEGQIDWWKDGQNTDKNKVIHYDDWRLPTKAEINKMIELQESSRAMDRLLVGQYYFCITGKGDDADINVKENWISEEVPNYDSGKTGYYIRCVRDVNRKK